MSAFLSIATLVAIFVLLPNPQPAHAGLFSWGAEDASPRATLNSQTIPLLHAVLAVDPSSAQGGDDTTVVGGDSLLPDAGPLGTKADIAQEAPSSDQISIYVVRKGDTLGEIAKMFNVSVNTIVWANNVKNGVLAEGQTLVILPISGIQYTIKTGDTISKIAERYKANATEIAGYNGIALDARLSAGDELIIPDAEGEAPQATPSSHGRGFRPARLRGVGGPDYGDYYLRPISGGVKTQGLHGYNAVDLASYFGAPIYAAADGQVIIARVGGWNGGYGTYIVIAHPNGTQTLYAHLSRVNVEEGWQVARGQVIGAEGATGKATGVHLHFEVRGARNPF